MKRSSSKSTSSQAALLKNEGYIYSTLLDKRKKIKPKFELGDLDRTADKKMFLLKVKQKIGEATCTKIQKCFLTSYQFII